MTAQPEEQQFQFPLIAEERVSASMLETADCAAACHIKRTSDTDRKDRGQFFTPAPVARFMAGLFERIPDSIRVLDAGAGVGMLTAALCDRLAESDGAHHVDADLFETDPLVIGRLLETVDACKSRLLSSGKVLQTRVRVEDFVSDTAARKPSLFETGDDGRRYDLAIMNPPYFKLPAESELAMLAQKIGPSQPNIYTLFMAAAIDRLVPGGELVAITPRSFCNGLYFRNFREWLVGRADLLQIHAFGSRTETFREAKVLQENIITHFRRRSSCDNGRLSVLVTRSFGRDLESVERQRLPIERIIDTSCGDALISIPEAPEDAEIVEVAENWPNRFADTGLRISTGPVVMFRTREFHAQAPSSRTVPLLTSHHIREGLVAWPRDKKKWPSSFVRCDQSRKHLVPTADYVLAKRFTAKEERRRLSAGVLRADQFDDESLAIENHLNYITHATRELARVEAIGVAALLNSAFMDRYFRSFSGNTQVNATEVRTMKFPSLSDVAEIGTELLSCRAYCPEAEQVVMRRLGLSRTVCDYLKGYIR